MIASPHPKRIDTEALAEELPVGVISVKTQKGGMLLDSDGTGDPVLIALAAVTVSIVT
jgi:hypothetical protein